MIEISDIYNIPVNNYYKCQRYSSSSKNHNILSIHDMVTICFCPSNCLCYFRFRLWLMSLLILIRKQYISLVFILGGGVIILNLLYFKAQMSLFNQMGTFSVVFFVVNCSHFYPLLKTISAILPNLSESIIQ